MLKTLDKYLLKSFFPPMFLSFFVASFVLIMQFFWKYIDDIIGKGVEVWVIVELVFYLAMTLVPMALPIAILVAAVMVMGNLSERYELATMKSAGIPLLRTMRPLVIAGLLLAIASMLVSNYVIPYSNLKFQSRLYDIRKQKPALSLQEGVFNDDFGDYTIRIGKKARNNRNIQEVLIYDHTPDRRHEQILVMAEEGEMYTTADERYMIFELNKGKQYQNLQPNAQKNYPFVRTSFERWEKVFDMSEFNMDRTDEQLFKGHYHMLTSAGLLRAIDSLHLKIEDTKLGLARNAQPYFHYTREADSIGRFRPIPDSIAVDTTIAPFAEVAPRQLETARQNAITLSRRIKEYAYSTQSNIERTEKAITEHWVWLHRKIAFAVACLMFIFIAAPMGAIIRKGGFGWSMLISISFFMLFFVLFTTGEKIAKEQVVDPLVGMYLPIYVILPIGFWLTYKAMNDSKVFSTDGLRRRKRKSTTPPNA